MACFRNEPEDWQRLDYLILREGSVYLYYKPEVLNDAISWLTEESYQIDDFDVSKWETEDLMHEDFASRLSFPTYYGKNLDALNDCLRDIDVPFDSGRAFVFRQYDFFNSRFPRVAKCVLDIVDETSRNRMIFGERLIALVQTNDPTLILETGRYAARWNEREWLDSNRGL